MVYNPAKKLEALKMLPLVAFPEMVEHYAPHFAEGSSNGAAATGCLPSLILPASHLGDGSLACPVAGLGYCCVVTSQSLDAQV